MAASSYGPNRIHQTDIASSSYFKKSVSLRDWWLIKAENDVNGKRLAVAGFTYGGGKVLRPFHSAPITKQYDVFKLETADGIIVVLRGFINKSNTLKSGFPPEIFDHFVFGFPPYWEEYAENCFKQAVNSGLEFQNISDVDKSSNAPGSKAFDLILTPNKYEDVGKNKHMKVTGDCSHVLCEKFTGDASKVSNWKDNTSGSRVSFQERSNISAHSGLLNDKLIEKHPVFQNEPYSSFLSSPRGNDADNVECDTSKDLSPSSCCVRNVSFMDNNIELEAEPPTYHAVGSSERTSEDVAPSVSIKAMVKTARRPILSENLKSKEKIKQISVKTGGSFTKKAQRKIIFDATVSPLTRKGIDKTCVLSAESLSLKRSRSGRLLLPTLEFWRNQIPVYDAHRNTIGIQGEYQEVINLNQRSNQKSRST